MWNSENKILNELKQELGNLGLKENTPEYNSKLIEKKIIKCQQMRNIGSCGGCNFAEYCSLLKEYVLDVKYKK